jgi:hypothetical protein
LSEVREIVEQWIEEYNLQNSLIVSFGVCPYFDNLDESVRCGGEPARYPDHPVAKPGGVRRSPHPRHPAREGELAPAHLLRVTVCNGV